MVRPASTDERLQALGRSTPYSWDAWSRAYRDLRQWWDMYSSPAFDEAVWDKYRLAFFELAKAGFAPQQVYVGITQVVTAFGRA